MWAWIVGLAKTAAGKAMQTFLLTQLAKLADWVLEAGSKWFHKLKMKKIKKAIDKKDNISVEESLNNPDAGEPSDFGGVQRRSKEKDKG